MEQFMFRLNRSIACETSSSSLVRAYPLSSPRRRGPIDTELSISRRPHDVAMTRRMGPRLRGDDSGDSLLHIFFRADERLRRGLAVAAFAFSTLLGLAAHAQTVVVQGGTLIDGTG